MKRWRKPFQNLMKYSQRPLKADAPFDVKISYQHQCILVSDKNKKSIEIYDLQYRSFIRSLKFVKDVKPSYLCVEHQIFEHDSLLVACSNDFVYKYDLKQLLLLETNTYRQSMLNDGLENWKVECINPCGMDSDSTLKYECIEKQCIYICERTRGILVVNSLQGIVSQIISISLFSQSVKVIATDELLVCEYYPNLSWATSKFVILKKVNNNQDEEQWIVDRTVGKQGTGEEDIYFPISFDFDHVSRTIIVSDTFNNRIQLFNFLTGKHVGCFAQTVCKCLGICLNETTGEVLFVNNTWNTKQMLAHKLIGCAIMAVVCGWLWYGATTYFEKTNNHLPTMSTLKNTNSICKMLGIAFGRDCDLFINNLGSSQTGRSDHTLNANECQFLNSDYLKDERDAFEFTPQTKVAFFVGSSSYRLWSKQQFFENVKEYAGNENLEFSRPDTLYVLNEKEKQQSGGYDVFVVSWSKIKKQDDYKQHMIKQLVRDL
ncbi:hypothetical protein C9374_010583 [Naegleria lovaniensis]|uniref:DUF8192 domain-containing protein n=1 Tax=Naegleria lovaniensis TaxID=51637 RepID=A0AA88GH99_NAELO|nr:uncharacterized protein C9374_010583 [Naegleria lovaniensis]KAG2374564.1 hypothetical protein C9374_010583 [Naegleria lovaniensis]